MKGTTPYITLEIPKNFDGCTVIVTIDQNGIQVTHSSAGSSVNVVKKYDEEGEFAYSEVTIYLTQSETLEFDEGSAEIQIRWINVLGKADKSEIGSIMFDRVLLERVIEYGEQD